MYSIQKYVLTIMKEKRIRKSELVKRLGYSNISKGCKLFDNFIKGQSYNRNITSTLHLALEVDREEIDEKLRETEMQIEKDIKEQKARESDKERKDFIPYLYCHTERRIPSPIFVCALIGADRMKKRMLPPDFVSLPENKKSEIRKAVISEALLFSEGKIPSFGMITCFTQRLEYDDEEENREVYDLNGDLIENPDKDMRKIFEGKATLTCKGQDITRFFKGEGR